jgi:hypothetical protein
VCFAVDEEAAWDTPGPQDHLHSLLYDAGQVSWHFFFLIRSSVQFVKGRNCFKGQNWVLNVSITLSGKHAA